MTALSVFSISTQISPFAEADRSAVLDGKISAEQALKCRGRKVRWPSQLALDSPHALSPQRPSLIPILKSLPGCCQ